MTPGSLPADIVLSLYRCMAVIRQFELRLQALFRSGDLPGFLHLCCGQEAVAAGVCAQLRRSDYVTSTHRGHGHALAKGVPARRLFAEVWGRASGCCGGRGGSMHVFEPDCGFLGSNGIVAAGIPQAAGAALAASLDESGAVAVGFFGDSAVNHASFHEGVNLAAVWNLPVVFVCENNLYGVEMAFERTTRNTEIATRAEAYGIPGAVVDGNDVAAVYGAAGDAVARARAGGGPTLLECKTYRFSGHHEGDPGTRYRPENEVESWKERCPLKALRTKSIEAGLAMAAEFDALDKEAAAVVLDAEQFAGNSPYPAADTVMQHLFSEK